MEPEPKSKVFENVDEVLRYYFEEFIDAEPQQEEKSPREEGIALAAEVVGNLEIEVNAA